LNNYVLSAIFKDRKLPTIEPLIKLLPTIKLIGNFTVSSTIKLTVFLFELFWIPIINKINKKELKVAKKNIFLNMIDINIS
tara:strand:- start:140 stop:382 length:243 start_codon:yes stop_codon:yes gene_type:complete